MRKMMLMRYIVMLMRKKKMMMRKMMMIVNEVTPVLVPPWEGNFRTVGEVVSVPTVTAPLCLSS